MEDFPAGGQDEDFWDVGPFLMNLGGPLDVDFDEDDPAGVDGVRDGLGEGAVAVADVLGVLQKSILSDPVGKLLGGEKVVILAVDLAPALGTRGG